jgi:outer membrane lipoprotein carrier protein
MGASLLESSVRGSRCIAALALGVALLAPRLVAAGPAADPTTLPEIIAAVQTTYAGVTAIRADFQQTVKNPMTGVEEKDRGRIQLERPRKVRLELGFPLKNAVVTDGTTQWIYAAEQKQVVVQKLLGTGSGVEQLIDNLAKLSDLFDVTLVAAPTPPKPVYQLALKPKTAGALKELDISLKRNTYHLQDLAMIDVSGNVTRMSFTGMVLGGDIPDVQFTFKAPPGVTVVQM